MSELKPCPFCGCKMYIVREGARVVAEGGHDTDCIMLGVVESYSNVAVLVKDLNKRPADTVVVPREPTESMLSAMRKVHWEIRGCQLCDEDYRDIYKTIVAIAAAGGE